MKNDRGFEYLLLIPLAALVYQNFGLTEAAREDYRLNSVPYENYERCPGASRLNGTGRLTVHERRWLVDDYEIVTLGSMEYLVVNGTAVSCGFHSIRPDAGGGFTAQLGAMNFLLDSKGKITRARNRSKTLEL